MVKFTVNLKSLDDVNDFIDEIKNLDADADASTAGCSYIVDAKSLMGLISLNFANPIIISVNTDNATVIDKFRKWMD